VSRQDVLVHGKVEQVDGYDKQIFVPLVVLKRLNQYEQNP